VTRTGALLDVISDVRTLPDGTSLHTVRLIYRVTSWQGDLRAETEGTTDAIRWVERDELASLPLAHYVEEVVAGVLIGCRHRNFATTSST
jgi:ADP-ribose pyrophosphatase YjhB (NUDIX family)